MTDTIERLEDVRPGDLYFGPIGGLVGAGVALGEIAIGDGFRAGRLSVRHVGIVTEAESSDDPDCANWRAPRMAQAMPGGAEIISLTADRHWTPRNAFVRLPEDYPGQALDAAAIAMAMVKAGVGYSFGSYALLAAWSRGLHADWLEARIDRRRDPAGVDLADPTRPGKTFVKDLAFPVEAICSVFADQAWSLAGKRVMIGVPRQVVTPGAMANQLWRRPGVVWGGAGLL